MTYSIFDIETDGMVETCTKIHCLCATTISSEGEISHVSLTNYTEMKSFIESQQVLIGHNIIRYDIPVLKRLLGVEVKAALYDTLALSWYLFPKNVEHGLEAWGNYYGVPKPQIADWTNLTIEEYIHRCSEDVKINTLLWQDCQSYLYQIYDNNWENAKRLIGYLSFKLDCAREQEEEKIKLDIEVCKKNLEILIEESERRKTILEDVMPPVIEYKIYSRPPKLTKKDGSPTVAAEKWYQILRENNLPENHVGAVKVEVSREKGNSGSTAQLKSWLFSLGWIPQTFDYKKNPDGSQRKVPQISVRGEGLCQSVKDLFEDNPELENLDGYFMVRHRIGLLEGFLDSVNESGWIQAQISGLTNTLRMQHKKPIANLPTIPKPHWEKIRGCLVAPSEDYVLCGSDMSGLEDNTKRHYMFYYDPDYVKEMSEYAFDAHCDIGVLSGQMSKDEETFYKWHTAKKEGGDCERILSDYYAKQFSVQVCTKNSATGFTLEELLSMSEEDQSKQMKLLKPIRLKSKKVNFSAVYGAGAPKISLTGGFTLEESKNLHHTYWLRNRAVKQVAAACIVKTVRGQMWLYNPVSGFWYSLRADKDRFSTLNQSTGVYCFDMWIREVRSFGIKISMQYHDEIMFRLLKHLKEETTNNLRKAIDQVNQALKLNVKLGISVDYGHSYADVH